MLSSRSSQMPCVGLLFSLYPSCPAWSRCGLLTPLAWAHWSRGIRHPQCGLIAVFSHTLSALVVLTVSVISGMVSSRSSHTPGVGSFFIFWGFMVAPPFTGREVGLWREIICNFDLFCFTLQVICTPTRRPTPMGLPSFPSTKKHVRTKESKIPTQREACHKNTQARKHSDGKRKKKRETPPPFVTNCRSSSFVISFL